MYSLISTRNKNISVQLHEYEIDIINDNHVLALVTKMPEAATDELVSAIKKEYHAQFDKDFTVSDASMAVEIWGHVFAEEFADAVERITSAKLVDEVADKIMQHCEVINIGEKGHDNNRFVWDALVPFKSAIADVLLKKGE